MFIQNCIFTGIILSIEGNVFDRLTLSFVGKDLLNVILTSLCPQQGKSTHLYLVWWIKSEVTFLRKLNSKLSFSEVETWVKFRFVCERLELVSPHSGRETLFDSSREFLEGQEAGGSRKEGRLNISSLSMMSAGSSVMSVRGCCLVSAWEDEKGREQCLLQWRAHYTSHNSTVAFDVCPKPHLTHVVPLRVAVLTTETVNMAALTLYVFLNNFVITVIRKETFK